MNLSTPKLLTCESNEETWLCSVGTANSICSANRLRTRPSWLAVESPSTVGFLR